jgi:hypothetical protein
MKALKSQLASRVGVMPAHQEASQWTPRAYQEGDAQGILELWNRVFAGVDPDRGKLSYWNWQFNENPTGRGRAWLAVVGEAIVGHYAAIPMQIHMEDKLIPAALSLGIMTREDYRRQGIFETLARRLHDELGHDGLAITYTFPNENSIGGLVKKLEWTQICTLPVYVKPLRPDNILAGVIKNALLGAVAGRIAGPCGMFFQRTSRVSSSLLKQVHPVNQIDSRFDELWQAARPVGKIAVLRSAAYLDWRYLRNPTRDYVVLALEEEDRLVAYAVVRCMQQFGLNGGMITELVSGPDRPDAREAVLVAAIHYSLAQRMDLCACTVRGDDLSTSLLRRNGFFPIPEQLAPKKWYFGAHVNNDSVNAALAKDPGRWYLTFGDTDVI